MSIHLSIDHATQSPSIHPSISSSDLLSTSIHPFYSRPLTVLLSLDLFVQLDHLGTCVWNQIFQCLTVCVKVVNEIKDKTILCSFLLMHSSNAIKHMPQPVWRVTRSTP